MEINVCFATNDRYAPHAAALVISIMENKSPEDVLSFHFFSDKTTPSVQDTFHQMSRTMGFQLAIYEMSDEQFADFPIFMGSRTAYFRLSMHRMLPESLNKILYLDCDIIVMSSLKELYSTDISDCYAAVVAEASQVPQLPVDHAYFNSGMVLFNLEKYRGEDLEEQAIRFGYEHPDWIRFADQEILNYIFKGNVVYLPPKWNNIEASHRKHCVVALGYTEYPYSEVEWHEADHNPAIIHYATSRKPWYKACTHPQKDVYWKYAQKTPFYAQVRREYCTGNNQMNAMKNSITISKPKGLAKIWREIKRPFRRKRVITSFAETYGDEFQKMLLATSCQSAEQIVPYIMELVCPESVVDVGCGVGAWLAAFRDLGNVEDHLGFDGDYIQKQHLLIDSNKFVTKNLEDMPITCERTFNLAVSLEVAEHLSEKTALLFVESLTRLAPVVLFSAAIPSQGGTNHINEQWPAYWAELFSRFQYIPVDCIRRKFWNNEKVSWWYSQNTILYVRSDQLERYPLLNKEYDAFKEPPLQLVHPVLWKMRITQR